MAVKAGWAEQDPQMWWENAKLSLKKIMAETGAKGEDILAIGISYQMHGLVCVDKNQQVLRPSIIWCDSRAVPYGEKAFHDLGEDLCLRNLLNSPGNFTASKLAWVKENEPELFDKIDKIMLPGDYLAMKLSGEVKTTISGLSEGMMWDFAAKKPAKFLLDYFGFDESMIADVVPTFSVQSVVSKAAAEELAAKIKGQVVTAKVKGGASGKLYGKVTGKEVAELLTALTGTEIDKKKVELPSAIKEFGSYDASVRLYAGVVAPFKLKVEEL